MYMFMQTAQVKGTLCFIPRFIRVKRQDPFGTALPSLGLINAFLHAALANRSNAAFHTRYHIYIPPLLV